MKRMIISILVVFAVLLGVSFALNETAYKNMQEDHLEVLQTLLPSENGFVVVPYDGEDANIRSYMDHATHEAVKYGLNDSCHYYATDIS